MLGVPTDFAEHKLHVRADAKPVTQPLRRLSEEKRRIVGIEIARLLAAGFIMEVFFPEWLANPVLVLKKNKQGGVGGSESGKESGTLESRASQGTRSVFSSIAVEVAAPEAVSSHPSSICAAGSELRIGAGSSAASRVLSDGRAKSCPT